MARGVVRRNTFSEPRIGEPIRSGYLKICGCLHVFRNQEKFKKHFENCPASVDVLRPGFAGSD